MKNFKEFVELEEGLKPEHKMRPGWMIKADPVLKAKIAANKAKQKEIKSLMGKKLKEELDEESLPNRHIVSVSASKDGEKKNITVKVSATSKAEAKGMARAHLKKKGYETHSATHHGIDYDWLKKEEVEQIDELSNDTLASYKKKAGESASEADKKGDFETGNKRFKGIMKATFKQFANDAKK